MLTTLTDSLAFFRFGGGGGGGFIFLVLILAIVGIVAWALARPSQPEAPKQ